MSQPITLISAMSRDHVIGTEDGMPWNVPEEYEQYRNFIKDQTVIMGRKSYAIFGPDLTSKHNFVVSRSMKEGDNYRVMDSLEAALEAAGKLDRKIFVAGGGSIYAQALPLADEMYLSYIKGDFEGIVYFPEFDASNWEVVEEKDHEAFEFFHYRRRT